jgi:hypothetical protein
MNRTLQGMKIEAENVVLFEPRPTQGLNTLGVQTLIKQVFIRIEPRSESHKGRRKKSSQQDGGDYCDSMPRNSPQHG